MIRKTIALTCALCLIAGGLSVATAAGLTQSASKVDVTAQYITQTGNQDAAKALVQLAITEGWHVNAHPASLDFLVPTQIEVRAGGKALPVRIDWPSGHDSGIQLGGTPIEVYSNNTTIPVQFGPAAARTIAATGQLSLSVLVQACSNSGLCLPPSKIKLQLTGL